MEGKSWDQHSIPAGSSVFFYVCSLAPILSAAGRAFAGSHCGLISGPTLRSAYPRSPPNILAGPSCEMDITHLWRRVPADERERSRLSS